MAIDFHTKTRLQFAQFSQSLRKAVEEERDALRKFQDRDVLNGSDYLIVANFDNAVPELYIYNEEVVVACAMSSRILKDMKWRVSRAERILKQTLGGISKPT